MSLVDLATGEACIPLNFFSRLPPYLKVEIDEYILKELDDNTVSAMVKGYYIIEWIFSMSPKKAKEIQDYYDDCEYFTALEYWYKIQPLYRDFFNCTDYYENYPEYLV